MCFGATCPTCCKSHRHPRPPSSPPPPRLTPSAKQSWRGCGSHLPTVFANVPEDKWCTCDPKYEVDGKPYPPAAKINLMPKMEMPSFLKSWVGGKAEEKEEAKK